MKQSNKHKRPTNGDDDLQLSEEEIPPSDDDTPEVDEDPEEPTPPLSARERRKQREQQANGEATASEPTKEASKKLSDEPDEALQKKLHDYTEEFRMLAGEEGQAAMTRRVELRRLMRGVQDVVDAREPIVEVQIPRSVTGEPFQIGERQYPPGVYHLRSSVAKYLLWMIDKNQRVEQDRFKSNGRTIDLGTIGSRARMARISRDDGGDHA